MERSPPPPPTFREWLFAGPNRVVVLFIVGLLAVVVWGMLPACSPFDAPPASAGSADVAARPAPTAQLVQRALVAGGTAATAEALTLLAERLDDVHAESAAAVEAARAGHADVQDVAVGSGIGTALLLLVFRGLKLLVPALAWLGGASRNAP